MQTTRVQFKVISPRVGHLRGWSNTSTRCLHAHGRVLSKDMRGHVHPFIFFCFGFIEETGGKFFLFRTFPHSNYDEMSFLEWLITNLKKDENFAVTIHRYDLPAQVALVHILFSFWVMCGRFASNTTHTLPTGIVGKVCQTSRLMYPCMSLIVVNVYVWYYKLESEPKTIFSS